MIRLSRRKDLPNRHGRGTIPQTQTHEKTLPGRGWQIPAAPGQEAFLTPYLTTVRAGTRGNSGFKSVKKYLIPSRKCWKALQITTKNLVQAFGSKMPSVRIAPLGPDVLWDPGFQREASFRMEGTGPDAAAARILAVFPGRCIIKNSGRRPAAGGWISASEGSDLRWSAYAFRCGDQLAVTENTGFAPLRIACAADGEEQSICIQKNA